MKDLSQNHTFSWEKMQFSVATKKDLAEIEVLTYLAYRDPENCGWTTESHLIEGSRTNQTELQDMIASAHPSVLWLCRSPEGQLLGCVYIEKSTTEIAGLGLFTVHPKTQGLGLGKYILDYVEKWILTNWYCTKIEISVIPSRTELVDFYVRRGFTSIHRFKNFPNGDANGRPKEVFQFEIYQKKIGPGSC